MIRGHLLVIVVFLAAASVFSQIPVELTAEAAARLQRQIESGSVEEKRNALFEIRNLRSGAASLLAVPALQDKNEIVRATAASSVVFLPAPEAARVILPLLNDKTEFVRREAAYALGTVGDASAAGPLARLVENEKILEVRTAAAVAVGKIGSVSGVDNMIAILRKRPVEDDEFLRRSAARAIGQIAEANTGGKTDVLTPQNFLPEKYKEIGQAPPVDLAERLPIFRTAVDVLTRVLGNENESDDTRREVAFALGAIGDKRSIPVLERYSTASDPYLAEISKEALLKLKKRIIEPATSN